MTKRKQTRRNKLGKKLLGLALDFYFTFDDDEVEDMLEIAINRFRDGRPDWRAAVRGYLWSFPAIRDKICDTAVKMWGTDD